MGTLRTDIIVDRLGTGRPNLTNGLEVAGTALTGVASQAEAEAGTAADKIMTPLRTKQSAALFKGPDYTSSESTFAANTTFRFAHGLGSVPSYIQARLRCATASNGFSVNDVIYLSTYQDSSTNGITFYATPTSNEILVITPGTYAVFNVTYVTLTFANFRLQVLAWK